MDGVLSDMENSGETRRTSSVFGRLPKELLNKIWVISKNPYFAQSCRNVYRPLKDESTRRQFYRTVAPDVLIFTLLDMTAWYRLKDAHVTADFASRTLVHGAITREDLASLLRYEFLDPKAKRQMDPLAVPKTVVLQGLGQLRLRLPVGTWIPPELRDCKEIKQAVMMDLDDPSPPNERRPIPAHSAHSGHGEDTATRRPTGIRRMLRPRGFYIGSTIPVNKIASGIFRGARE